MSRQHCQQLGCRHDTVNCIDRRLLRPSPPPTPPPPSPKNGYAVVIDDDFSDDEKYLGSFYAPLFPKISRNDDQDDYPEPLPVHFTGAAPVALADTAVGYQRSPSVLQYLPRSPLSPLLDHGADESLSNGIRHEGEVSAAPSSLETAAESDVDFSRRLSGAQVGPDDDDPIIADAVAEQIQRGITSPLWERAHPEDKFPHVHDAVSHPYHVCRARDPRLCKEYWDCSYCI